MTSLVSLNQEFIQSLLPDRPVDSYKKTFGHTVIIGGNSEMAGAALMAAKAAVHVGSGLTTVISDPANKQILHTALPEAMVIDWFNRPKIHQAISKADTVLIGPGLGHEVYVADILLHVLKKLKDHQTLVIDGDAIKLFKDIGQALPHPQVIFTPHKGEWDTLFNEEYGKTDQELADKLGAIIVKKSEQTTILNPDANYSYQNILGNPGMAIGGMGDTLSGMIAGLCGQCQSSLDATLVGTYLHTYIANQIYLEKYIVLPSELAQAIPTYMKKIFA